MVIEKLEDIEAWQKARELVKDIYRLSNNKNLSKDFGLKDQLRRASVSIMANIAEGFDSQSDQEYLYSKLQEIKQLICGFIRYLNQPNK